MAVTGVAWLELSLVINKQHLTKSHPQSIKEDPRSITNRLVLHSVVIGTEDP